MRARQSQAQPPSCSLGLFPKLQIPAGTTLSTRFSQTPTSPGHTCAGWGPAQSLGPQVVSGEKFTLCTCSAESNLKAVTSLFSEAPPASCLAPARLGPGWARGAFGKPERGTFGDMFSVALQVSLHPVWQPHRTTVFGQCPLRSPAAAPVSGHDGSSPRRSSVGKKGQGTVGGRHLPHSAEWEPRGISLGLPSPKNKQFGNFD